MTTYLIDDIKTAAAAANLFRTKVHLEIGIGHAEHYAVFTHQYGDQWMLMSHCEDVKLADKAYNRYSSDQLMKFVEKCDPADSILLWQGSVAIRYKHSRFLQQWGSWRHCDVDEGDTCYSTKDHQWIDSARRVSY